MANVTTNFSSAASLNTALALINSGWSLDSALSWAYAAFDSDSNVAYFTSVSSSYVAGRFVNSDDFQMWGSNLTGYPATTTRLDYIFNPEGITASLQGNVITYSDFTQSGYVNNILVSSAAYGSISIVGYDNVAIYGDGTISSVTWDVGGAHMVANGALSANVAIVNGYYQASISGYYTSATISYAGNTYTINNFALDANASFATPEAMLAAVLSGGDAIDGSVGNDYLNGYAGNDILKGSYGNDILKGSYGNDYLDGGDGTDTAQYDINSGDVFLIRHLKLGGYQVESSQGVDTLINIEQLGFTDKTIGVEAAVDSQPLPSFETGTGGSITPTVYMGPVAFLETEYLGGTSGEVVIASSLNDFLNLLGGDDAANGGGGDDVLDGGTGSNFLTGGAGNDTFFLDGRGGTTTWSTITDFRTGDQVNIWGWQAGVSKQVLYQDDAGAASYTGGTFHYDLNNDGLIDTSITFTGLHTTGIPTPSAHEIVGNGYLLFG